MTALPNQCGSLSSNCRDSGGLETEAMGSIPITGTQVVWVWWSLWWDVFLQSLQLARHPNMAAARMASAYAASAEPLA